MAKGQIEEEFEINNPLIDALEESEGTLDLDLIIQKFRGWFNEK